jgi:D-lactate dehydrogenase (cytochrome)
VQTVIQTIQSGIPVARIELLDDLQMRAVNRYSKLLRRAADLFFEFHGTERGVVEQAEQVARSPTSWRRRFSMGDQGEDRNRLWQARHDVYYAALALRPGAKGWSTDVCVPISRLAECISATKADIGQSRLLAPLVGHVGDGNFHLVFVIDPDDADELERAKQLNDRMVMRALALGGTCTGEHGIGYGKIDFLAEHGEALPMRAIKQALGPPGCSIPADPAALKAQERAMDPPSRRSANSSTSSSDG